MRLTDELAEFAVGLGGGDVPSEVAARWSDAIVDCAGVGLAGAATEVGDRGPRVVEQLDGRESGRAALLLGRPGAAGPLGSALHNGTACHALDYDDTLLAARSHVSAHLLPVLIAIGEEVSGGDALLAYGAGCEIEARIGLLFQMRDRVPAWHPTGVIGTIGAAATAARVLCLDVGRTKAALAIAASASSGLRANTGSMVKPIHAGYAARNGVLAALLAEAGVAGNADALDADGGFVDAFGSPLDVGGPATVLAGLGSSWESCGRHGLAINIYPSCSLTHCAIEAALELRDRVDPSRISSVIVDAGGPALAYLPYSSPVTGLQAKFSMQFCVAAALRFGQLGMDVFERFDEAAAEVGRLLEKVSVRRDTSLEKEADDAARVTVVETGGRASTSEVLRAKGTGRVGRTRQELGEKFVSCASRVLLRASAAEAFRCWRGIGGLPSLRGAIESLRASPIAEGCGSRT